MHDDPSLIKRWGLLAVGSRPRLFYPLLSPGPGMPSVSSLGSRSCLYESSKDGVELCGRGDGSSSAVLRVVRRALTSHQKGAVLGSILGVFGAIALLVSIFFLARYFMYREAMAADMPIQTPVDAPQQPEQEEKPMYPPMPIREPIKRTNTPDPGTYMPNHPYALTYGRRDSVSSAHPTAPAPIPSIPPPVPALVISSVPHPYSQQSNPAPASTIYESFMSPESSEPTERGSSPIASTVGGGAYAYPPSPYDTMTPNTALSDEAPSATNSTAPLQGTITRNGSSYYR